MKFLKPLLIIPCLLLLTGCTNQIATEKQKNSSNEQNDESANSQVQSQEKQNVQTEQECLSQKTSNKLSINEALQLAQNSACVSEASLTDEYHCNETTGTWWIDLLMNRPNSLCHPACVINVDSKKAEINGRCTGALPPPPNINQESLTDIGEFNDTYCVNDGGEEKMLLSEALQIALNSECKNEGFLEEPFTCLAKTGQWSLRLNKYNNSKCVYYCKVDIITKEAKYKVFCMGGL